jgi:hypothetical protein
MPVLEKLSMDILLQQKHRPYSFLNGKAIEAKFSQGKKSTGLDTI